MSPRQLFKVDYATKTRTELNRILYKRKQALINQRAILCKHQEHLAEAEADPASPYKEHIIRYARYLLTSTEYDIETRESDIALLKAFQKTASNVKP